MPLPNLLLLFPTNAQMTAWRATLQWKLEGQLAAFEDKVVQQ
ncbi:MAG: hypothetical protein QTN59_05935 [Candidatus Electrothrix communis]|nr:MAG: hypothetical protein QTN59_05935 [Candidatus Electrothrix communis]